MLPRDRPLLLPDAVPTKFPGCPAYLSKKSPVKRKPPTIRVSTPVKIRRRGALVSSSLTTSESTLATTSLTPMEPTEPHLAISITTMPPTRDSIDARPTEDFTFDTLLTHDFVRNSWSRVVISENNLRFICWPSSQGQFLSMKYVDVDGTLSVRVSAAVYNLKLLKRTKYSETMKVIHHHDGCCSYFLVM